MDKTTVIFLSADAVILLVLIFVKTIAFFQSTRKWSVGRWFYFNKYDIYNAPSEKVKEARIKQNKLSISILVIMLLSPILYLLVLAFI